MDADEKRRLQRAFLRAWLATRRVSAALEKSGLTWPRHQAWRRHDLDYRYRSDIVRMALEATR